MRWKATERAIAKAIGGERVPITGRQRGSAPDIAHPLFSIEVKDRDHLPAWMHEAMSQAVSSIRGDQLPVVILHEKGMEHADDFCVMRLGDWKKVYLGGGE